MKHTYSEILIAIAEGKDIQYQYIDTEWRPIHAGNVLLYLSSENKDKPAYTFRVKPSTININGVECKVPDGSNRYRISILSYGFPKSVVNEWSWGTERDRDAAYAALIKPFGEQA